MIDLTPDVVTVAVTRVDGGVTVLKVITAEYQFYSDQNGRDVTRRTRTMHHEPTPEYIESLIAKRYEPIPDYPNGVWHNGNGKRHVSWRIVPNDYVDDTTDRTYRNAWKDAPGRNKPDHDMPKAREIHREHLRNARQPELDTLDIDFQRADERGDQNTKRTIATRKQKLRDVTDDARIESAATVEELKTLTLERLTT